MFYTKVGKNEFGKLKSMLLFAFFLVPVVVFVIGAEVPQARAAEFAEAAAARVNLSRARRKPGKMSRSEVRTARRFLKPRMMKI